MDSIPSGTKVWSCSHGDRGGWHTWIHLYLSILGAAIIVVFMIGVSFGTTNAWVIMLPSHIELLWNGLSTFILPFLWVCAGVRQSGLVGTSSLIFWLPPFMRWGARFPVLDVWAWWRIASCGSEHESGLESSIPRSCSSITPPIYSLCLYRGVTFDVCSIDSTRVETCPFGLSTWLISSHMLVWVCRVASPSWLCLKPWFPLQVGLSTLLSVRLSVVVSCAPVRFLWTQGNFCYVFYCDECSGEVISSVDGLEPSFFGGKTCGGMEVPDERFDAQKFVCVVDGLNWPIGRNDGL